MKILYTLLAAGSLLVISPTTHAARRTTIDEPTEAARKSAARERAATTAKAAKAAKAAKNTKKSYAYRFRKLKANVSHSMLVLVGLEESKAVTSPAKLNRQLHIHQKHLKTKAKLEAKARRRRASH